MSDEMMAWKFRCPQCGSERLRSHARQLRCDACDWEIRSSNGIFDLLPPVRSAYFEPFLNDYTKIRLAEGRRYDADAYRSLPECPGDHPLAGQWDTRARSYLSLLGVLSEGAASGLKVVDLGGGFGWLSHRLRDLGHLPCTIDISDDTVDGLGGAQAFEPDWPLLRGEFESLPLAGDQADVVIFNASFHYALNATTALTEALRVIRPNGRIIIMDTPVYRNADSGRQMQQEQHADFERRFGMRSDRLPTIGYLTWTSIGRLGEELGIEWRIVRPWYGWRWALRPLLARLRGRREPAKFALLIGTRIGKA